MTNEEVPPKSFLLCPYGEQHYTKDGKYIANFWSRGDKWVYSIQDTWDPPTQYLDAQAKKRLKNKGDRRS